MNVNQNNKIQYSKTIIKPSTEENSSHSIFLKNELKKRGYNTPLIADIPEKARLLSATQTPLRSLATPEDIANTIAFLASDRSNYLTGETIRVNGGQFML